MSLLDIDCVVPTHGRPAFLAECLESIAQQTVSPAQVVVVSDDANRRSREVVGDFQREHPGIECLFVERPAGADGASASRNEGARHGRSPAIAFLDDDDLWGPGYLLAARTVLEAAAVDAVVTSFQRFSTAGMGAVVRPRAGLSTSEVFRRSAGVTGSSIVVRRRVFDAVGGFDSELPVQNDRDFFLRLLLSGCRYGVVDEPMVQVRDHRDGRLTDASLARADGILLFLRKHGARFKLRDRRVVRYVSHRTRMSSARSAGMLVWAGLAAVANWSPAAEQQIPLGIFRTGSLRTRLQRIPSRSST